LLQTALTGKNGHKVINQHFLSGILALAYVSIFIDVIKLKRAAFQQVYFAYLVPYFFFDLMGQ
jgi:uncharacterized protein Veg